MAKVFIEETTLTAIGDAIRGKEGTTELVPVNDMATRITSLPSGGGAPSEFPSVTLTGDCSYLCAGPVSGAAISNYPNKVNTSKMTITTLMFCNSTLQTIPFDLDFQEKTNANMSSMFRGAKALEHIPDMTLSPTSYHTLASMFQSCLALKSVPYIYNAYPSDMNNIFYDCERLISIPDDYFDTWNFDRIKTNQYSAMNSVFCMCYSLRKIPSSFFEKVQGITKKAYSASLYYYLARECKSLDELVGVPVILDAWTLNAMQCTVDGCFRLKKFTFGTNEDGTPIATNWKSQVLDFSRNVGYGANNSTGTNYNQDTGITADKQVTDDASYQALKNDPDWFTIKLEYSRYNHDSALETINSLPDTSAYLAVQGGTNTIKFTGAAGSKTDGGAINTLTEEEIAVAAAKGWTVTLV